MQDIVKSMHNMSDMISNLGLRPPDEILKFYVIIFRIVLVILIIWKVIILIITIHFIVVLLLFTFIFAMIVLLSIIITVECRKSSHQNQQEEVNAKLRLHIFIIEV